MHAITMNVLVGNTICPAVAKSGDRNTPFKERFS